MGRPIKLAAHRSHPYCKPLRSSVDYHIRLRQLFDHNDVTVDSFNYTHSKRDLARLGASNHVTVDNERPSHAHGDACPSPPPLCECNKKRPRRNELYSERSGFLRSSCAQPKTSSANLFKRSVALLRRDATDPDNRII
ncbi:hypothetical protein EVAR_59477_1 [Eumeta japonica]|uniref:Uncharacterized protein n=1 Tax=Eumeta variegata TaxID=151549 RepID=A0A4C1Z1A6_EUMVA|nr:hypothetical protein EVAR_59477_1 [Eumeta japonica]